MTSIMSPMSDIQFEEKKYPDYVKTMVIKDANGVIKELVFPKALDLDRPKRARTTFTAEQLYKLEREFQRNQYLVGKERTELSKRLELSETQVKVWFQNRRTKYKKDKERDVDVKSTAVTIPESSGKASLINMFGSTNSYYPQQMPYASPFWPNYITDYASMYGTPKLQ